MRFTYVDRIPDFLRCAKCNIEADEDTIGYIPDRGKPLDTWVAHCLKCSSINFRDATNDPIPMKGE